MIPSKEDILYKKSHVLVSDADGLDHISIPYDEAIDSMDEYAKEIAIGFFTWYGVKMINLLDYIRNVKTGMGITSQEMEDKIKEFEGKPIEELYNQYLSYLNTLKQ